jgi:hypothetical protein
MTIAHRIGAETARLTARALPKRLVCSPRYFSVWESAGYHIVPLYHESPVPQPSELEERLWEQPSEMFAIDLHGEHQLCLLDAFRCRFKAEYDTFPRNALAGAGGFHLNNGWFEKVDAEILYCMIREFRPAQIIEVGSGVTTKSPPATPTRAPRCGTTEPARTWTATRTTSSPPSWPLAPDSACVSRTQPRETHCIAEMSALPVRMLTR